MLVYTHRVRARARVHAVTYVSGPTRCDIYTLARLFRDECHAVTASHLRPLNSRCPTTALTRPLPPPVTCAASLEAQAGPVIQLTFIGPCITYASSTGCTNGTTATCKCQLPYFPLTFISNGNMSYVE